MAFVQATHASSGTGVTSLATPAITTTGGNLICRGSNTDQTVSSVTDSKTNTWTPHGSNPVTAGAFANGYQWYAKNITGGASHTFTDNYGSSSFPSFVVAEFSGCDTTAPLDTSGSAAESSATTNHSAGSVTTGTTGCDICAFNADDTGAAEGFTAGSGWTIPTNGTNTDGTSYVTSMLQYMENKAIGTYTNTATTTQSDKFAGLLMAFKPASGAAFVQSLALTGVGS